MDSQHRSLLRYVEEGRSLLQEIRQDFSRSQSNPEDSEYLRKAARRLASFSTDADGWGFDSLYRVAFGLQTLLLDSFNRFHDGAFWKALDRGVDMLFSLLDQCESEYVERLAIAELLEGFNRISCNRCLLRDM